MRLIAVTGYGQETDRTRSREAGFHEHLVKPITIDVVVAAIGSAGPTAAMTGGVVGG